MRKASSNVMLIGSLIVVLTFAFFCLGCSSNNPSENGTQSKAPSALSALTQEVYNQEAMSKKEAKAAARVLKKVGLKGMTVDRVVENGRLDSYRGMIKGHQVNFTTDRKKLFYVQITGFSCWKEKWYINWRGKLKWGSYQSEAQFDLYNTDSNKKGYLAKYDQKNDKVIPWSEIK